MSKFIKGKHFEWRMDNPDWMPDSFREISMEAFVNVDHIISLLPLKDPSNEIAEEKTFPYSSLIVENQVFYLNKEQYYEVFNLLRVLSKQ